MDYGCAAPAIRSNEAIVKKIHRGGVTNLKSFRTQINYLSRNTSPFADSVAIQRSALFFGQPLTVGTDDESKERFDAFARDWLGSTGIYREGEDAAHQMTTHLVISWPRRDDLNEEELSATERQFFDDNLDEVDQPHLIYPPEVEHSDDRYEKMVYLASRQWAETIFRSCEGDGFDYLTAFHGDTDHYHMHVVVNRRSRDEKSWLKIAHRYDYEVEEERDAHDQKIERAKAKAQPHRLNEVGMQEMREEAAHIGRRDFGIPVNATTRASAGLESSSESDGEYYERQRRDRSGAPGPSGANRPANGDNARNGGAADRDMDDADLGGGFDDDAGGGMGGGDDHDDLYDDPPRREDRGQAEQDDADMADDEAEGQRRPRRAPVDAAARREARLQLQEVRRQEAADRAAQRGAPRNRRAPDRLGFPAAEARADGAAPAAANAAQRPARPRRQRTGPDRYGFPSEEERVARAAEAEARRIAQRVERRARKESLRRRPAVADASNESARRRPAATGAPKRKRDTVEQQFADVVERASKRTRNESTHEMTLRGSAKPHNTRGPSSNANANTDGGPSRSSERTARRRQRDRDPG